MAKLSLFPAAAWLRRTNRMTLRADLIAGLTNAAIVLPQGVAFATIAGLPPEYGLYTAMVTAVIAALFGASMVMVSGPTTAISALVFATLAGHAEPGSARYIELALTLTLLVGVFQIVAGLARLGALISFVSHSVIVAFTAAAAVLIGISQLAGVLGVHVEGGGNLPQRVLRVIEAAPAINPLSVLIAGVTLATVAILGARAPRAPGFLIALIMGAATAAMIGAEGRGVEMLGAIPAPLPSFASPSTLWSDVVLLAPGAAAIALVGLLEAISIGRSFALRRREPYAANQEIVGQGLSNMWGSFFQCYAGSGSFTRSGVNAQAGARTPLAAILSSLFLALILISAGQYLTLIPLPAMAGLIIYVAWRLIDWREIRHVVTTSRPETVILLLTLMAGLILNLDFAIYVGVIASLSVFIHNSAHPSLRVSAPMVAPNGRRKFRNADLHGIPECPQIVTLRLDGPLYFGSVEHVEAEWNRLRQSRTTQVHVIFYLKGVGRIDLAGADLIIQMIREIRAAGGSFHIVALFPPLLDALRRFHVATEIGENHLHASKGDALAAILSSVTPSICAGCNKRVFLECSGLEGAKNGSEIRR
jgi:sulfate permease, SulP family